VLARTVRGQSTADFAAKPAMRRAKRAALTQKACPYAGVVEGRAGAVASVRSARQREIAMSEVRDAIVESWADEMTGTLALEDWCAELFGEEGGVK